MAPVTRRIKNKLKHTVIRINTMTAIMTSEWQKKPLARLARKDLIGYTF